MIKIVSSFVFMDKETIAGLLKRFKDYGRTFWRTATGKLDFGTYANIWAREKASPENAILVGSRCEDYRHAPVLDLDFPAQLVPSSTPGHFHLYLEKKMTWEAYKKLLEALAEAGIINWNYCYASINQGQTMVLLPGLDKKYFAL